MLSDMLTFVKVGQNLIRLKTGAGSDISPVKREVGETPTRSRRCKVESAQYATGFTGKAAQMMKLSQKNCLFFVPIESTCDRGGAENEIL